jgi:3-aminobutyryl-CoA ammonia-lyase
MDKVMLRVRISEAEVHYAGGLVDGAHMLKFFGDVATELLIRHDGDEGLFAAYDAVEFKGAVYAGDYLEIYGWIDRVGNTSRHMQFEAYKVITSAGIAGCPSACNVLAEPQLVTKASGTCVVPANFQRGAQDPRFAGERGQA